MHRPGSVRIFEGAAGLGTGSFFSTLESTITMAKIVLGKTPKSFTHTVTIPMLDGTTGEIECKFKYRTRKQFGEFVDRVNKEAREAGKAEVDKVAAEAAAEAVADAEVKPFSLAEHISGVLANNSKYLVQILDGWNLEAPLTVESAEQLGDEVPGAVPAIIAAYRTAISEGTLGN
ncbi:hypothetical protein ASE31_00430 [Acidovorax sp. Root217]|nr:hypothetical protein ASE31_00430 [Acidovorax sp. Root217]